MYVCRGNIEKINNSFFIYSVSLVWDINHKDRIIYCQHLILKSNINISYNGFRDSFV